MSSTEPTATGSPVARNAGEVHRFELIRRTSSNDHCQLADVPATSSREAIHAHTCDHEQRCGQQRAGDISAGIRWVLWSAIVTTAVGSPAATVVITASTVVITAAAVIVSAAATDFDCRFVGIGDPSASSVSVIGGPVCSGPVASETGTIGVAVTVPTFVVVIAIVAEQENSHVSFGFITESSLVSPLRYVTGEHLSSATQELRSPALVKLVSPILVTAKEYFTFVSGYTKGLSTDLTIWIPGSKISTVSSSVAISGLAGSTGFPMVAVPTLVVSSVMFVAVQV